jgi:hypothetical protein
VPVKAAAETGRFGPQAATFEYRMSDGSDMLGVNTKREVIDKQTP